MVNGFDEYQSTSASADFFSPAFYHTSVTQIVNSRITAYPKAKYEMHVPTPRDSIVLFITFDRDRINNSYRVPYGRCFRLWFYWVTAMTLFIICWCSLHSLHSLSFHIFFRSCYTIMRNVLLLKKVYNSNKSCISKCPFQMRLSFFSIFAWESSCDLC